MPSPSMIASLSDLTWQEAEHMFRQRPVGLLPIGATEAHGPHLPLDTDVIIAEGTARRAGEWLAQERVPTIILPPVVYTVSFVGTSFAGTVPVAADAFEQYLASVLLNAVAMPFRAIICCNAHLEPAHVERVQTACATAEQQSGTPVRAPDQRAERFAARLSEEFRAGARHAGSYETSIVMALKPESVRTDALDQLEPVWIDLPAKLRTGARTFSEAGAELGYFGNPAIASPEEGDRLLDGLAEMILDTYQSLDLAGE